ncbi:alpha/beta hydrolase [Nocardia acididurans]|nr:alpha/beta hydrolase [Nocardia acididurans]
MLLAASTTAALLTATGCGPAEQQTPTAAGLPERVRSQSIAWHDCRGGPEDTVGEQLAAAGALCGEFQAPLDYANPGGRTITIAVARRAVPDSARRLGTLVAETGGPGPSREGVALLVDGPQGGHPATAIAERYDLVGMDPRFFGASTPLECGWPTGEYLGIAQAAPVDRAGFERTVTTARALAQRCEPQRELLPHASTRAVARDLDLLRTLLGESELSYLGWSWGTYLGAVYLRMFGDRVDRIVLDSALDPRAPGADLTRETAGATAAALADWARWVAARDDEFGVGASQDAVLRGVEDTIARIAARPLLIAGVTVTADMVPGLLLTVDDSDESYADFARQVRGLTDAALGATIEPPPSLAAKLALYSDPSVLGELGFSATVANQCADRAARDVDDYFTDITAHLGTEPIFGALARHLTPCAVWPTRPAEPATTISSNHPALLIGADGDPVAPLAGQLALRQALPQARSLTLKDAFRHGVYLMDRAPCIDAAVERYLLEGELPATDAQCERESD